MKPISLTNVGSVAGIWVMRADWKNNSRAVRLFSLVAGLLVYKKPPDYKPDYKVYTVTYTRINIAITYSDVHITTIKMPALKSILLFLLD